MFKHLKESLADTGIALLINIPLNYTVLFLCDVYDASVLTTTLVATAVFTVIAIVRKCIVRDYFDKRETI